MPLRQDRTGMGRDVFDIFAGTSERNAVWREDATTLKRARERMQQIAAAQPGDYFIYHTESQTIVERTSTKPQR